MGLKGRLAIAIDTGRAPYVGCAYVGSFDRGYPLSMHVAQALLCSTVLRAHAFDSPV